MGRKILGVSVVIGTLVAAESASGQAAGRPDMPVLNVLVLNQAHVRPEVLRAAEVDASSIYEAAGVRMAWHSRMEDGLSYADIGVIVKIASDIGTMRAPRQLDEQTLGLAAVEMTDAGPRGRMVWVFFDRVEDHATRHQIGISRLCGLVMAHEIGHLVLPSGHSEHGVMRATWDLRSRLLDYFTDSQARVIRTRLASARTP